MAAKLNDLKENYFHASRNFFSKKLIGCFEESAEKRKELTLWAL